MADGVVDIAIPDSSPVAADMKEVRDQILNGEFDVFDQGTIADQEGTVIIEDGVVQAELLNPFDDTVVVAAPGDTINDGVLLNMNFFVENVVGSVSG